MGKEAAPQRVDELAAAKAMIGHIKPASEFVWFPGLLRGSRADVAAALRKGIVAKLNKDNDPSSKDKELVHVGVPNGVSEDVYTFEVTVAYKGEERVITVETPMERARRVYDEYMAKNVKK